VLNIIGHKKTDNWTTRTETGKPMPTRKEVSLYRNVVQLSDYTGGRFNYELMDLRTAKNAVRDRFEAAQLSYYAFGADVPEFPN
jgi:hypothetical protein